MRILSPFKDYYDFVVSEPDNKKVYIRETKNVVFEESVYNEFKDRTILSPVPYDDITRHGRGDHTEMFDNGFISILAYCDKLHYFLQYNRLIYWDFKDIPEDVAKKIAPKRSRWEKWKDIDNYDNWIWGRTPLKDIFYHEKIDWVRDRHTKEPIKTNLNKKFGSPLVFFKTPSFRDIVLNPKLVDIGFNKVLSPTETYQDIYNWIPYNEPEVPSSPNDMSRYEAKGFDKKTSFRPNMK